MWQVGPNFFCFEPFHSILNDAGLSAPQKIEACYALSGEEAAPAIMGADARWWYHPADGGP